MYEYVYIKCDYMYVYKKKTKYIVDKNIHKCAARLKATNVLYQCARVLCIYFASIGGREGIHFVNIQVN